MVIDLFDPTLSHYTQHMSGWSLKDHFPAIWSLKLSHFLLYISKFSKPNQFSDDLLSNRPDSIFNSSNNKIKCFSQAFNFSKLTSSRNRLMIFGLNPVPIVVNPLFLFNVVWCGRLRSPLPRIYSYVLETKREK